MKLKIEYLPKEELKPYANNAKIHTAEQVEQIKKSIREFGFNDPIAVWHDNEIIEGHGRLLAAMEMDEIETVPVIRLDDLTDEQRRAYMLTHNKLTMNTDFDIELLDVELSDIDSIDMEQFGFFDLDDSETEKNELVDVAYNDKCSVVIDCENETEAGRIYDKLQKEGYSQENILSEILNYPKSGILVSSLGTAERVKRLLQKMYLAIVI